MAVIIDTNCFANVFSRNSANHNEFKPVLDWILKGKGIIIFGGTKYKAELGKAPKYMTILRYLKEKNKVFIGNDENIDRIQSEIETLNQDPDFDDPHLPAIVIDTKCKIICSEDKRSIPFVKSRKFYPNGFTPPVYYTSQVNKLLLCDENIDERLKPLCKLKKEQLFEINKLLH
jgi:hypothetical protein